MVCVGTQDAGRQASAAVQFLEARELMREGRVADACPRFEAALRAAPGVGIELNLAECWARTGRTATAWRIFRRLASSLDVSDPRGVYASQRAGALEPALARLDVRASEETPGLVILCDAAASERGPVLVDPGEHRIDAAAPEREAWTTTVRVEPGTAVVIVVPPLTRVAHAGSPGLDLVPAPRTRRSPARVWVAAGVAGAGLVSLAATGALLVVAKGQYDDALENHCDPARMCDDVGVAAIDAVRVKGTIATVTGAVGLAALAGGTILYLTAPRVRVAPAVVPGGGVIRVEGTL